MSQVKIVTNGMAGLSAAAATIGATFVEHVDPWIKVLAGFGGLVVIGMTIVVSLMTARRTRLEMEKLRAEIDAIRSEKPKSKAWSDHSP